MILFQFKNIDGAMEFWTRVKDLKADSLEARQQILVDMAKEGYMDRVMETNRPPEQLVKDWSEHCSVLYVHAKEKKDETN